jgi:hypothetical protein
MAKKNVIEEALKAKRKPGSVEQAQTCTLADAQEARKLLHELAGRVKSAQIRAAGSAYMAIIDAAACAYAGFQAQQAIQRADDIAAGRKPALLPADLAKVAEADAQAEVDE